MGIKTSKWRRWTIAMLVAFLAAAGTEFIRPADPVSAYNLMAYPFARQQAQRLVAAQWPQHHIDNSAWYTNALISGFNAWNDAGTGVFVSMEFVPDGNAQILYWTDTNTADRSTGGCQSPNPQNNCIWALMQLVEGAGGMDPSITNYDQEIVAHEEGHSLGLAHSCVAGALMASDGKSSADAGLCTSWPGYSCSSGESSCVKTPQQDDINGMTTLYGVRPPPGPCIGPLCRVIGPSGTNLLGPIQQIAKNPPIPVPIVSPPAVPLATPSPGVGLP